MPLCLALAGLFSGGAGAKSVVEQNGGWLAYTDHRTAVGLGVDNEGELSAEARHVLDATNTSGLIGEAWLQESAGGLKLSLNWIPADGEGRPDRTTPIRKAFVAIDQNHLDDRKISVGGGLENKDGFVAGYLSHALSGRRALTSTQETVTSTVNGFDNGRPFVDTIITTTATERYERAFDWGVGIRAGRYLEDNQLRLALGLDHEWGGNDARQTTLSAEAEKFFAGSPWSVTLRGEVFSRDNAGQDQDDDGRAWLILRYSFGEPARRPTTYPVAASAMSSVPSSATPSVASTSRPIDPRQAMQAPTSKQTALPSASSASAASPASSASTARVGATQATPADTAVAMGADQGAAVQAGAAASAVPAMRTGRRMVKTTASMLTDAFFKFDSAKLTQETVGELDQVIQLITGNGFSDRITLTGHTCDIGTEAYNEGLSQRRADSVKRYLTSKGKLPEDRIDSKGMGERVPKYPNTRAERYKNRRVDVEFLAFVDKEELVQIPVPVPVADIPPASPAAAPAVPAATTMAAAASGSAPMSETKPKTEPITEPKTQAEPMSAPAPATAGADDKATAPGPDQPPALIIRQEIVELEPAWIQYGLLNTIPHKRTVDTYRTEVTRTTESSSRAFVNRAPIAADDAFTVTGVAPMTLPVLNNDSDPDGDALHIESVTQPASGSVSITGDTLTYTTAAGAGNGNVQFSYTVNDGNGGVVTANVVLTLSQNPNPSPNQAPQAVDDAYSVSGVQSTLLDVLANDSDPDGDALTIFSFSQPLAGSLSLSGNGLLFTPFAPFWRTTFTYTIVDGHGGTSSATVNLVDP